MTKAQEIQALKAYAEQLPADTYTRPMLLGMLGQLERDLAADFIPDPLPQLHQLQRDLDQMKKQRAAMLEELNAIQLKQITIKDQTAGYRARLKELALEAQSIATTANITALRP